MVKSARLINMPKRNYELKRVHIYDRGGRNSVSGVEATVFGGSSILGMTVGSALTSFGSTCIYPYRGSSTIFSLNYKELKPTADLGHKAYVQLQNFTD